MVAFIQDFGILFITVVAISFIVKLLRQPIIVGYVLSGLLFSVYLASQTHISEQIILLSQLGILFLLFLMGLEFDFKSFRNLGLDMIFVTVLQSVSFLIIGFALTLPFEFAFIERSYIAIVFMFSSTLLVAKWIEDKKENKTLHGKIILATLIIQDIIAIISLTILGVLQEDSLSGMLIAPLYGIGLAAIAIFASKFLLNKILAYASKLPELLFIFSIGVGFAFVELALLLGYTDTIGAFIGGVVLANTIYRVEIATKLRPLIIFFNLLFFVGLGFQMDLFVSKQSWMLAGLLTLASLILKPIFTYVTLRIRGYPIKVSFLTSLNLSSMSEFGIIIVASGITLGLVSQTILSIIILSAIASMILSSYMIKYDAELYKLCGSTLHAIDKLIVKDEIASEPVNLDAQVVFFGYYEFGKDILEQMKKKNKEIIVIEQDPYYIEQLKKEGISYLYSTVSDPDFFEHVHFDKVELIVSNLTDIEENRLILSHIKKQKPHIVAIVTAKNLKEALALYKIEADYVIYPTYVNEQQVSVLLEEYSTDISKVLDKKVNDISRFEKMLEQRKKEKNEFFDIDKLLQPADTMLFNMFKKKEKK